MVGLLRKLVWGGIPGDGFVCRCSLAEAAIMKPSDQPICDCGVIGDEQSFCFGAPAPELWLAIPEAERETRVRLEADLCVIDRRDYFICGCLDLPIVGTTGVLRFLVWVSLSETNFNRAVELWGTLGREAEPPYFGWLNTRLPGYPETLNLKTHVHTRPVGERPAIELEPTGHPLAVDQREGITPVRARDLVESMGQGGG